jgi:hypothetical protein
MKRCSFFAISCGLLGRRFIPVLLLCSMVVGALWAAVPSNLRITAALTPSNTINTKYRDGDDGTAKLPLGWGACGDITGKESGGGFSVNIATYCELIESTPGAATVTASTLGTGWSMTGSGNRTLTLGAGVSDTLVTFTATQSGKTATKTLRVQSVAAASADTTAPTIPLSLTATADSTGIQLSWDPSMDPHVTGENETGIKDYQIFRDGSGTALATVTAASVGLSAQFVRSELGGAGGGSTNQSANTYTLVTSGGIGTTDNGEIACASVTGDFVLSALVQSVTGGDATNGAGAINARDSTTLSAGQVMYYSRLNRGNNVRARVRTTVDTASTAVGNSITQAAPAYLRMARVGNTFTSGVSSSGNAFQQLDSRTLALASAVSACLYGSNGATGTTTVEFRNAALTQGVALTYHDTIGDGASHSYTIKARDNTGTPNASAASASVSATAPLVVDTNAPSVPSTPACLDNASSSTVPCSWSASTDNVGGTGVRGYIPSTATSLGGTYTPQAEQTAITYSFSGLSATTTRCLKVAAIDNSGNQSAFSTADCGTSSSAPPADTTPPSVPTGCAATPKAGSTTVLTLSGCSSTDSQSGIQDYRFYASTSAAGPFTLAATCPALPCDYSVGSAGATRYFGASARDGAASPNESAQSAVFSGTTNVNTTLYKFYSGYEYPAAAFNTCGASDFTWTAPDGTQWITEKDGGSNTCLALSTDHSVTGGSTALKVTLTRDSGADVRSELRPVFAGPAGTPSSASAYNQEIYYGIAIYVPANFVSSSSPDIVWQGHTYSWLEPNDDGGTSPTVDIQTNGANWRVLRRWNTAEPSLKANQQQEGKNIGAIQKGAWNCFVIRAKWHWSNGETQVWLNGNSVYNANGGNTSNDLYSPYVKWGLYRVANTTSAGEAGVSPRVLYFDNPRMKYTSDGGSFAAVSPCP